MLTYGCGLDTDFQLIPGSYGTPTNDRPDVHTGDVLPVTLGHEFCGRIQEAPPGCPFAVGQAVMVDPHLHCTQCTPCSCQQNNICDKLGFLGLSGGGGGGLSEFVAVNWQDCHAIPESMLDVAALIEPLAVARHALHRVRVTSWKDESVLVLGGGPIGQAVLHNLRAVGCTTLMCSEVSKARQDQVRAIGCTIFDPTMTDVASRVRAMTGGHGATVVFDCAGVQPAFQAGMEALGKRGTLVMVASWTQPVSWACD
jgi:threonine dehydrogenase-like Zn-dependent dehydrogenase